MCGIVGVLGGSLVDAAATEAMLRSATDAIAHRGPDDMGVWIDTQSRISLGHRRLAVLDTSPAGHQPMTSVSGRYVITFNGEIYNHLLLRSALPATEYRGHSDTETLLAAFDTWGIHATTQRAIGMFAFAVWDRQTQTLILGRDRIGEKPLYYGWQGQGEAAVFLFGSELKALRTNPMFESRIDRDALCLQLRHNYIPAPYSIYQGIFKLKPGSLLTVSLNARVPKLVPFWSALEVAQAGAATAFRGEPEQAVDELELLLKDAVRQQMVADVPLGAFLSGGVDSSTIVALMQAQSSRSVRTFTIGFNEPGFDEAKHAKAVAEHLGTEHTEMYVSAEQALAVIPLLPSLYDEPFSDSSQIPTFLVAQLAKQDVTVSLSGDAGDELFGGYERYRLTDRLWRRLTAIPLGVRKVCAKGILKIPPHTWGGLITALGSVSPWVAQIANAGDRIHKGASVLASQSVAALYLDLISHWSNPTAAVVGGREPATLSRFAMEMGGLDDIQRMMAADMVSYLPDDILVKVDRAAMGVSLETRVPFLDHRVVEFAWHLPQSMKLRDGQGKWILRQVLHKYVPQPLIQRPKMGFGVPLASWLRGPLRDWAEDLLDAARLSAEGYFDPKPVRAKWTEHLSGHRNWQYHLWDVLMFQAWLEAQ